MKTKNKSLFNLIEIFRSTPKQHLALNSISQDHCSEKYHHDFYCDAEKPFIASNF
ncbi:hypothetical protein I2486_06260 [Cellulophaga sp. E16_2]|uniref:Uncharacterized protein n=1 Tax=Cellulophaga algicola (strain DSM 14237 / IC166 / ACAM 630) TaxID=688270 RepID=E6X7Z1_CELAD|nr:MULTISPECIES: hypothetical protein [unclassified Cellulophaga]ADV48589.1 hypothetical protein Celal_1274 [Cellulophaga algicola DSM 14237]MBO0591007.1 hypothetical protein [Cellulophaga sp. E16_2]